MSCLRTQRSASGKARNRNPSIKIHDWQCTQLGIIIHSAVSYQHIYGKSKHTYTIFPLIAPNIARWSGRACFCLNHRRSDNQKKNKKKKKKTEVGEASDKILNIWTHAIFLSTTSATNECSDESAHLL